MTWSHLTMGAESDNPFPSDVACSAARPRHQRRWMGAEAEHRRTTRRTTLARAARLVEDRRHARGSERRIKRGQLLALRSIAASGASRRDRPVHALWPGRPRPALPTGE